MEIKQEPCDQNTKDPMKMEMLEIKKEVSDENCMEEKSHGEGLFKGPLIFKFDRIVENKFQLMFHKVFNVLLRKDKDVNEHERLSNITLRHKIRVQLRHKFELNLTFTVGFQSNEHNSYSEISVYCICVSLMVIS